MSFFSLLSGVIVRRELAKWGLKFSLLDKKFQIKWPNDILYANKKLAGILCESQTQQASNLLQIIIGVGINIHSFPSLEQLNSIGTSKLEATSIANEMGGIFIIEKKNEKKIEKKKLSRSQVDFLLKIIIKSLDQYFLKADLIAEVDLISKWKKQIISELNLHSFLKNKKILIDGKEALCREVDIDTASQIIEVDGNRQELYTADFTLL